MKQNEIEKNGLTAPASPVATKFTPFVGELGGKPVLIWGQTSSGLARLKNPDFSHNPSAVPVSRIPAIRHLEVVEGKKSRYAVIKGGYLDLTTGQLVDNDVKAAIDKYREAKASAPAPAPTPAPAPAPVAAPVVAEAKAPATSKAPAFSWKDWWKLSGHRGWAMTYWGTNDGSGLYDDALDAFTSLGAVHLTELSKNVSDLTLDCDNEVADVTAALAKYTTFTQNFKSDLDLLRSGPSCFDGDIEGIRWRPLTVGFPLSWEVRNGADFTNDTISVLAEPELGFLVGINGEGRVLIAKDGNELEVVASAHIQRIKIDHLDAIEIRQVRELIEGLAQEVYGYHPSQLMLF
jgi:hypothetical protein